MEEHALWKEVIVHKFSKLNPWCTNQSKNGSVTALIWGALPQPRCDRRKDRVETNPEQLTAASVKAEISFLIHDK
ncbi:hypothetical protein MTR67_028518 [Solanum verrucosum]|uniref:Uncharacterized protein n=1 Tax=Solanum verrucosum TaxID=315347 RepID=A0AAF0R6S0_SOLVR|nr:hypothetical protein MTR67_028518 [Solanum verrucosum]